MNFPLNEKNDLKEVIMCLKDILYKYISFTLPVLRLHPTALPANAKDGNTAKAPQINMRMRHWLLCVSRVQYGGRIPNMHC